MFYHTLLIIAALNGNVEMVRVLLSYNNTNINLAGISIQKFSRYSNQTFFDYI